MSVSPLLFANMSEPGNSGSVFLKYHASGETANHQLASSVENGDLNCTVRTLKRTMSFRIPQLRWPELHGYTKT